MKILHIVLYEKIYPPVNGGMLRCWNLNLQLSKYFEVDLLCLQSDLGKVITQKKDQSSFSQMNFIIPEQSLRTNGYKWFNKLKAAIKYRWFYKTVSGTNSILVKIVPLLEKIKGNDYEMILFEHLESLALTSKIKKIFPYARLVFNAHNIDHVLLKNKVSPKRLAKIKLQESELRKRCDLILACSEKDNQLLNQLNQKRIPVITVPNGVDATLNSFCIPNLTAGKLNVIFCGSLDYEPNYTGMIWFLKAVWPFIIKKFSFIKMIIVGRGMPDNGMMQLLQQSDNIKFIGEVQDVIPYYRDSQLAVVPILHGSGTRLKILEAMSLGVPVLSTTIGAEGINYATGKNIIIADSDKEFIEKIEAFINNRIDYVLISKSARELIEKKYSWDIIGNDLSKEFENFKEESIFDKTGYLNY